MKQELTAGNLKLGLIERNVKPVPFEEVSYDDESRSQSLCLKPEQVERKPGAVVSELYSGRAAHEPTPLYPCIPSSDHVKAEPIEIDIEQNHSFNGRQETVSDLEDEDNTNIISVHEEKLNLIQNNVRFVNSLDLSISAGPFANRNDDLPSVLENPPTPRYDTTNRMDTPDPITSAGHDDRSNVIENPPTLRYDTTNLIDIINPITPTGPPNPVEPEPNHVPATESPRDGLGPPPAKRRRVLFDAVVLKKLPSSNSIRQPPVVNGRIEPMDVTKIFIKPGPVSRADKVKLKYLRGNLGTKPNKEAVLSDAGVVHRFHALGPDGLDPYPINLENDVKMAAVTRNWMTDTYGGNHRCSRTKIDKKKLTHGIDNFRYINYKSCPDAPRIPGAPGLVMGIRDTENLAYTNQRIFMPANRGHWLAMGLYDCVPSNPLSKEEWKAQSPAFRNFWVSEISSRKWAAPMRVRIMLRDTLGREPSVTEYEKALKDRSNKKLSTDLIKKAFASGHENLSVWCMKCVGYDTDLQRDIANMPKNYVSPSRRAEPGSKKEKVAKTSVKTRTAAENPTKAASKKRKR